MMGRKKGSGKRVNGRLSRAKLALVERNPPALHILERRRLFSFVTPAKGPDGRVGEIDQDVCDGIGQLHAVGLLDGHEVDGKELRDAGRFFGERYWTRYRDTAPKTGSNERTDRSISEYLGETPADRRFDRMDLSVTGYERQVLMSLVVDRTWADAIVPWAESLIHEELLKRKRIPPCVRFPTCEDRAMLQACIRALLAISGNRADNSCVGGAEAA